ncbi:DNA internalization-related competence protein ComEC/Rec2 [Maridesulfovibrio sp.]|uniref:DNA internalization-related competence protein ComEC/Rec2 n=1 Tax=Maridesulfovibrio sp. TaxID=2795000 RepID=UPI002A18B879|nr:DNA internalization-related competence protein ComEC/Rec2 [Maridesulfovibrio sp.]
MSATDSDFDFKGRSAPAGLLSWQKPLPALVFGLLAIKWFIPSCTAFLIYLFLHICFRSGKWTVPVLCLFFGLGFWYGNFSLPVRPAEMPAWMAAREKVLVSGRVSSVRAVPGNTLKILLQDVHCNSTEGVTRLEGYLNWTWAMPDKFPLPGQQVEFVGRVKPTIGFRNSGLWDYGFYNQSRNIFYRAYSRGHLENWALKPFLPNLLQRIRISLRRHIIDNAPADQGGAFFPALLAGERFYLSKDTVELVRRAGVSHVLALSGLHVGFVASIGFALAWLAGFVFPRLFLLISRLKLGVILAVPFVLFYLWLGQFTPSLLRAACMFGFWGLLLLLDRGRILMDGLFLAVFLILLFAPLSVFDLGFQLSVLAVTGIGLLFPFFRRLMPPGGNPAYRVLRFVLGVIYVSLCANLALLPVLLWNFGTVSPNFLFNVIVVPLLGLFVVPVCGFGGLAAAYIMPEAAQWFFSAGSTLQENLLSLIRSAAQNGFLPEYAFYRPLWEGMIGYYLVLGGLLFVLSRRFRQAGYFVFPLLVLLVLRLYPCMDHPGVRVDLLDTGQSQCVVITGPRGTRTVVDGGGGFGSFDMGRAVVGPWLCSGRLPEVDNVLMTHGDRDHAGGLAFLLEKFRVGRFFTNGDIPVGKLGERFNRVFESDGIIPSVIHRGDRIELEPGLVLEVLHPSEGFKGSTNDRSLCLRLVWNGRSLLGISGDLDRKGIKSVLGSGLDLRSQVLILPHHGSAGGFSPRFYDQVDPEFVLAACGMLNRFNFVAEKVRKELEARDIPLFTTADCGMITVVWGPDGELKRKP